MEGFQCRQKAPAGVPGLFLLIDLLASEWPHLRQQLSQFGDV